MSAGPISKDASIYVAGHRGLVGSAIVRRLKAAGFTNILGVTRQQLDLRDQAAVNAWFRSNQPEYVFLVAGTVGGILANSTRPAEFIYDNLMIHATVVEASRRQRRQAPALPRELVHLPARLSSTDSRGVSPERPPRSDQRALRHRQDLRYSVVPGISAPVRMRFHLGDADESLRARGQLRS